MREAHRALGDVQPRDTHTRPTASHTKSGSQTRTRRNTAKAHLAIALSMLVIMLTGCGRDVQLGQAIDAGIDTLIDAMPSPFAPGTYSLTYMDPSEASCDGTLSGAESDFAGMTAASLGLVNGDVMLIGVNEVVIRLQGTPISSGYNRTMVDLTPNPDALPPEFPQTIWDTVVAEDFGGGPDSTRQLARYFGIDSANASVTGPLESAAAIYFETGDTMGACFVSFAAVLTSQ